MSFTSMYMMKCSCQNSLYVRLNLSGVCRYQFNPAYFQTQVTSQILLKALTNLPHTDFTLCKCMIDQTHVSFWCRHSKHVLFVVG